MSEFKYSGNELKLFANAINWKNYYKCLISKYLKDGLIIEVGAGIGDITKLLKPIVSKSKWICIEPDKDNFNEILIQQEKNLIDNLVNVFNGTLEEFTLEEGTASVVMMIDSLEHIKDDSEALKKVDVMLEDKGFLIIIVPAHNLLYSKFDEKIGHFRRYNKKMLRNIIPHGYNEIEFKYIDCIGFFLNAANKIILKSSEPNINQIKFWDSIVIPFSIVFDKFIKYSFGKNIVFIAQKNK